MQRPHHPMGVVGDRQGADSSLLHQPYGLGGKRLWADRDRARGHCVINEHGLDVGPAFEHPAQIAVGENADQRAVVALDRSHAHALAGDLQNGLGKRCTK